MNDGSTFLRRTCARPFRATTTHRYQKPGDYIVRVEPTDRQGFKAIAHLHVPVGDRD